MIDHTMLKAGASKSTIVRYYSETREHKSASVRVNICSAPSTAERLKENDVKTCCIVELPLGAILTSAKAFEASEAVKAGTGEVDMVINISTLEDGNNSFVKEDVRTAVKASTNVMAKVIVETCLLTNGGKVRACQLAVEVGADFMKTSAGFSTGGAMAVDAALIHRTVGNSARVKTSSGIHTPEDAVTTIETGADRIGTGNKTVLI